ncbi:MAG: hypothetical protein ACHP65_05505 [Legionellales bacterium]
MIPDFDKVINGIISGSITNIDNMLRSLRNNIASKAQLTALRSRIAVALAPQQNSQLSDDAGTRARGVAYFLQGIMHQYGLDCAVDNAAAMVSFKLAMEHGNLDAMLSLGSIYCGEAGEKHLNYTKAAQLYRLLLPHEKAQQALMQIKEELVHHKKPLSNLGAYYHLALSLYEGFPSQLIELKKLFNWEPLPLSILLLEDRALFSVQKATYLSPLLLTSDNATLSRLSPRLADIGTLILDQCFQEYCCSGKPSALRFFKPDVHECSDAVLNQLLNIPTTTVDDYAWLDSWIKTRSVADPRLAGFLLKIKSDQLNREQASGDVSMCVTLKAVFQYNPQLLDADEKLLLNTLEEVLGIGVTMLPQSLCALAHEPYPFN